MKTQQALQHLTTEERTIIKAVIDLLVTGQYIEDWEFHTRLGITREQMALVSAYFPETDRVDDEWVALASIHNGLNEVVHGVDIPAQEWQLWFDVSKAQVETVLDKWLTLEEQS